MKRRSPAIDEPASTARPPEHPEVTLFNIPGRARPGAAVIDVRIANRRRGATDPPLAEAPAPAEAAVPVRSPADEMIDARVSAALQGSGLADFIDWHDEARDAAPDDAVTQAVAADCDVPGRLDDFASEHNAPVAADAVVIDEVAAPSDELLLNAALANAGDETASELPLAATDDDPFVERPLDAFPSEGGATNGSAPWPSPDEMAFEEAAVTEPAAAAIDDHQEPGDVAPAAWNGTIADPWSESPASATEWRPAVAAAPVPSSRRRPLGLIAAAVVLLAAGVTTLLQPVPLDPASSSPVFESAAASPATEGGAAPLEPAAPMPPPDPPADAPAAERAAGTNPPSTAASPVAAVQPARSEPPADTASAVPPPAARPGTGAVAVDRSSTPVGTTGARHEGAVAANSPRARVPAVTAPPTAAARRGVANPAAIAPRPAASAPPPATIAPPATVATVAPPPASAIARTEPSPAPSPSAPETAASALPPAPAGESDARPPAPAPGTADPGPGSPGEAPAAGAAMPAEAARTEASARADATRPGATARPDSTRATSGSREASANDGITDALKHLQVAYERRDATLAKAVWPTVNERALARAFEGLRSQSVIFDRCQMNVSGAAGEVECRGVTTYVPRVGSQYQRTESRQWKFRVQKGADRWVITSAAAR